MAELLAGDHIDKRLYALKREGLVSCEWEGEIAKVDFDKENDTPTLQWGLALAQKLEVDRAGIQQKFLTKFHHPSAASASSSKKWG